MVAGAGGGACSYYYGSRGGNNLGLTGESGFLAIFPNNESMGSPPQGGDQIKGGRGYQCISGKCNIVQWSHGMAGRGGDLKSYTTGGGAGGSGFFGGGSGGYSHSIVSSGIGGSSFVSGCKGCAAMIDLSTLEDIEILGANDIFPSPFGKNESGHYGNGFARISVLYGGFILPPSCKVRRVSFRILMITSNLFS